MSSIARVTETLRHRSKGALVVLRSNFTMSVTRKRASGRSMGLMHIAIRMARKDAPWASQGPKHRLAQLLVFGRLALGLSRRIQPWDLWKDLFQKVANSLDPRYLGAVLVVEGAAHLV